MLKRLKVAGFHVSIASDAEMSTKMGTLTQPRNGLLTRKALLMHSRTILRNGTTPTTMGLVTTCTTTMVWLNVLPIVAMDAEQPMACRRLIDGVAQIRMKTDGLIQHLTGLQVLEVRLMLGQKTLRNGMIVMETVVVTILLEPQRMYVHLSLEHR